MRRQQTLAILALLLALALSACGDGGDEVSTSAASPAKETGEATAPAAPREEGATDAGGAAMATEAGKGREPETGDPERFVPKRHDDSGGGSDQFRAKNGDNSVQEFGEEAGGSEFDEVASALHAFLDARARESWAAACSYLAPHVVVSLEKIAAQVETVRKGSCAASLEAMTNPAGKRELRAEAAQADVGSVRVEGETAFVIYRAGEEIFAISMIETGDRWKVAALAGYPLR